MKKLIILVILILGFTIQTYSQYNNQNQSDTNKIEITQQLVAQNYYNIDWNSKMNYNYYINKQIIIISYMNMYKPNLNNNINNVLLDPFRWWKFYNFYIKKN